MTVSNTEPPLVDVKVTNPVTYLRRWWEKVMDKEGVYFSFRIHPITAFLIAFGLTAGIFSIGRYSVNIPFLKYEVEDTTKTSPTFEPIWKETAFTGKLQYSPVGSKYFLITTSSEAITLEVPNNLDLFTLIGKRIFAVGEYNKQTKILKVADVKDLEVLSKTPIPIPTIIATPAATPSSTPIPTDVIDNSQTNL
ncbi:hypothetical protein A2422_00255 [Candidatus Woesebacteria bacterium RIFOXYC1_FULL_31_51]|uniref:Uncharacterized protein n=1 Tax=Candidatus Woesebacteria bacterium GW2011_GWC2_31_9 TaxID=1618586 RepID=A0A0F9YJF5_9BACT|nr:MAG: hypothetical protein UR17_C0001G0432 [Candidatus Woesebacteria bacterium GW2011_GWF1_31_35]KKP23082.1 MAG: hypothetical protein UR11_C0001G0056 [Candidatus Woesebacteria bacterium GW2011_GWC1_30_29]KKP26770.1 MAG: hypothetical protein UR13_C0002G0005 [Candidatus Woesebacteria bacterium GW2011_GWD1_31_12]KKP27345.1 MAG: hypothetical protein UR16_C0003G0005 [Candidatus Woesebacteria bacterium GW2011_GWB1_31_29]KKP31629.1 MAG: hypothetical protein UR21_C0007G0046 [Candidatus Woesebacteria 